VTGKPAFRDGQPVDSQHAQRRVATMRALVQRVREASVSVADETIGVIGPGLCILVGATHSDTSTTAAKLADKVWNLRVFDDVEGNMNVSLADASRAALVVSQFTLYGDTARGRRPGWAAAAPPEVAEPLIESFSARLRDLGSIVATGRFRANMQVALVNDGPVTLMLEVS
jgi:D-tyrosyl-tRNA(Tyr) deacylase